MKLLSLLALFFSLNTFAQDSKCLQDVPDLGPGQGRWIYFLDYAAKSGFGDYDGYLCAEISPTSGIPNRVAVYSEGKVEATYLISDLNNEQVIFHSDDAPEEIQIVIRSGDLLTLKINEAFVLRNNDVRYKIEAKFLRNIGKGFGAKDYRKIQFTAHFSAANETFTNSYTTNSKDYIFDELGLNITTLPVAVNQILLSKDSSLVFAVNTNTLPK